MYYFKSGERGMVCRPIKGGPAFVCCRACAFMVPGVLTPAYDARTPLCPMWRVVRPSYAFGTLMSIAGGRVHGPDTSSPSAKARKQRGVILFYFKETIKGDTVSLNVSCAPSGCNHTFKCYRRCSFRVTVAKGVPRRIGACEDFGHCTHQSNVFVTLAPADIYEFRVLTVYIVQRLSLKKVQDAVLRA